MAVNINKELKGGDKVLLAHVMLIQPEIINNQIYSSEFSETLQKFKEVFAKSKWLPPQRASDHLITLIPNIPTINMRPYRYSQYQKQKLDKIIKELLRHRIQLSMSLYASLSLLVKNKDGSWRLLCRL
jgi:hypothetical protein